MAWRRMCSTRGGQGAGATQRCSAAAARRQLTSAQCESKAAPQPRAALQEIAEAPADDRHDPAQLLLLQVQQNGLQQLITKIEQLHAGEGEMCVDGERKRVT